MSDKTVTVAEAAEILGVTEKAVRRRIERGVLPSLIGPDKRRRIPASAIGGEDGGGPAVDGAASSPTASRQDGALGGYGREVFEQIERLAREAGQLRQIEQTANTDRQALIEARARILELEAQLAERPARRGFWRR